MCRSREINSAQSLQSSVQATIIVAFDFMILMDYVSASWAYLSRYVVRIIYNYGKCPEFGRCDFAAMTAGVLQPEALPGGVSESWVSLPWRPLLPFAMTSGSMLASKVVLGLSTSSCMRKCKL